jgi:two-component system chemotaxis response regulator CheY
MSSSLVLIVDDDEGLRTTARTVLEDEGYIVELAANGVEALKFLQDSAPPVLVLLDLMMPLMNGLALIRELEARAELARIPVVIMTAASVSLETSSLRYPLLRKPFNLEALLDFVTSYAPSLWNDTEATTEQSVEKSATAVTETPPRPTK